MHFAVPLSQKMNDANYWDDEKIKEALDGYYA